jgi:hypothetical protein
MKSAVVRFTDQSALREIGDPNSGSGQGKAVPPLAKPVGDVVGGAAREAKPEFEVAGVKAMFSEVRGADEGPTVDHDELRVEIHDGAELAW